MDIWLERTIKAHDFMSKDYWENSYNTVKDAMAETYGYEDEECIKGFISIIKYKYILKL